MQRRNWIDLSRKRVDRFDFLYTTDGIQQILQQQALALYGPGVLTTAMYPNPFAITLSASNLSGSAGPGVAFDSNGNSIWSNNLITFTIPAADPALPRKDLLILRYKTLPDSPIPKPSDPLVTVYLNLLDSFDLILLSGTPAATPNYPTKGPADVTVIGIRVPVGAVTGTQCTLDLSVQDRAGVDGGTF